MNGIKIAFPSENQQLGNRVINETRYRQLDALRGLAALTVVISHFTLLTPIVWLRHTPLRAIAGGHEAVMLFFVLSGFVLTLQLGVERKIGYAEYIVKRICRIYLPYLCVVMLAYACYLAAYAGPVDWAGAWFNSLWGPVISTTDIARHLLFVLPFRSDQLDPVIWSLIYEMRISIAFPLLVFACLALPSRLVLCGAFLLSIAVCVQAMLTGSPIIESSVSADGLPTLHYQLMFVTGILMAKHRTSIVSWFRFSSSGRRATTMIGFPAIVLYVAARPVSMLAHGILSDYVFDWVLNVACAGIIVSALGSSSVSRFLMLKPIAFLGEISYSLYLTHLIVLCAVVHLVGSIAPPVVSVAIAAILIIPGSYLVFIAIERPSMRLGKRLFYRPADTVGTA